MTIFNNVNITFEEERVINSYLCAKQ
uniref:Uncharacterized protein n=1 Tax=Rhizophora mucronata TaxID=61149 RepID=A0A2P2NU61_RHIMU